MFIPLRTNRTPKRRPIVTELLIITNMLVYLAGLVAERAGAVDREALVAYGCLWWRDFRPWQLITYQFIHDPGAIWHLAFNMLFLWVFGCAVEDRLGRLGYLGFYLIGGAVAGGAHMMINPDAPVIGASGSIAAVTGAFLALFPRSRIQILFLLFLSVFSIPALWFIGLYFVIDVLRQTSQLLGAAEGPVALSAHIAGYVYGFSLAFVLLATGVVPREEFDVFFLFKQARRRAAFRAASKGRVGGLWESASADTGAQLARRTRGRTDLTDEERAAAAARAEIDRLIAAHELPEAAARYRELLRRGGEPVLSEDRQLDVANQLQAEEDHANAARAYELLLRAYPTAPRAPEVRLMLALTYLRRLGRPQRAKELLEEARTRLGDADQRALVERLLAEMG